MSMGLGTNQLVRTDELHLNSPCFFFKGFPEIWFGFAMDTTSIQHNLGWCGGRVVCDESSLHKTNLVVREPVRNQ